MINSALEKVKYRNDFYRDNFRRASLVLLISILINMVLLVSFIISLKLQPEPKYFATTTNGQLIRLHSLLKPIQSDSAVISWLSDIIPHINELDFLNYRTEIQEKRKYFTKYGWEQYLKAFKPIIEKIK
ncbi:DotI/IcmL/TraM family protein [Piscirickettsia litoralis]|uniref:DotI/IcmL/TraM family protein n=1 Tax=Piscirickettsia litoralis TaxID=1891921 RepID=UPI002285F498|nr:DotI/IcmL/TraM family protein [Piscirickettsia litoralis]